MRVELKIICTVEYRGVVELTPEEFRTQENRWLDMGRVGIYRGGKNTCFENKQAIELMERAGMDSANPDNWGPLRMVEFQPVRQDRDKVMSLK